MLNIVIPMAGAGSRFALQGYVEPKPLIPVRGQPMISLVIDNLRPSVPHRFIFICQRSHARAHDLHGLLNRWAPGCAVVLTDGLTQGAACTVLQARSLLDNRLPLMIANSDQFIDAPIDDHLAESRRHGLDGLIMTMTASDPKWSFVGRDAAGQVERVVEKQVISDEATVGIYNFARGQDFVSAAEAMIAADQRVNGEFYVAPVYNAMIARGQRIGTFNVGRPGQGMHGLGTPEDLKAFLARTGTRSLAAA